MTLYGSSLFGGSVPAGQPLEIEGASQPGLVTKNGLILYGADGKAVSYSVVTFLSCSFSETHPGQNRKTWCDLLVFFIHSSW